MKINFQTNDIAENNIYQDKKASKAANNAKSGNTTVAAADFQYQNTYMQTDFFSGGDKKGKSLIELQQEAGNVDVGIQQDYMTVMSNTLSEEDYAKLEEDGFHFKNVEPDAAVTIVDKIKAELAGSGQVIAGYNDDLDMDVLAEAVGSETLARSVADSMKEADLPLTEDTLDMIKQAWNMASQLESPDEASVSYLIDNELQPEIWNLYLAENSGGNGAVQSAGYYAEDIQGYFTRSSSGDGNSEDMEGLKEQIDRIIAQSGREPDDESRADAKWLLDRNLPVTAESLNLLADINSCEFPVTEDIFAKAAASAIVEGKNPIHADLSRTDNIYEKAAQMLSQYTSEESLQALGDNITARRQMEEVRLRMTAEVNVKLLKSNYSIDTAPMEQLIEALKQAEQEVADKYFPGDEDAVSKYQLYNQTNAVVDEIPTLPAQILGSYSRSITETSLSDFYTEGKALKDTYIKANESYETMMTAPRSDLGDSIRKAFANVDDILKDLNLEFTDENRRSVRILGYNRMEITPENIEKVMAADTQVKDVVKKMTPASTLRMIRDGINPLEKSFTELNEYFDESSGEYEEQSESYSKFLYRMERQGDITDDEREAYIGVFRMLRQIERTDGAAVGALVNSQAQIQFSNLLSAVRSGKFKHLDVKVEDSFGAVSEVLKNGESISDQIARGFVNSVDDILTQISESAEADSEYYESELEQIRQAAGAGEEAVSLLQRGELDANAANLLAAEELINGEENLFAGIGRRTGTGKNENHSGREADTSENTADRCREALERASELSEKIDEGQEFKDTYTDAIDQLKEAVEELSFMQDTSVDVREMNLIHKQLNIVSAAADNDEYILPMYIGDDIAQVHLSIRQQEDAQGEVNIRVKVNENSVIEADFRLQGDSLTGILQGNNEEEVTKLQRTADIFCERISEADAGLAEVSPEIKVIRSDEYIGNMSGKDADRTKTDGAENIELYRIAKLFLQSVRQM
jgi:hypothetical protein